MSSSCVSISSLRYTPTIDEYEIPIFRRLSNHSNMFIGYPRDNTYQQFELFQFQQVQIHSGSGSNTDEQSIDDISTDQNEQVNKLGKVQILFTEVLSKTNHSQVKTYSHQNEIPTINDVEKTKFYKVTKHEINIVHV
jgi:hypothetical protein